MAGLLTLKRAGMGDLLDDLAEYDFQDLLPDGWGYGKASDETEDPPKLDKGLGGNEQLCDAIGGQWTGTECVIEEEEEKEKKEPKGGEPKGGGGGYSGPPDRKDEKKKATSKVMVVGIATGATALVGAAGGALVSKKRVAGGVIGALAGALAGALGSAVIVNMAARDE